MATTTGFDTFIQPDDSDSDGGYSTGSDSDTTSLSSSVQNYKYENGRRYHSYREGQYVLPNDEKEQDRLDLFHHIFTMLLGGELQLAPIGNNPQRVLDVGTGTGIWAIDFADQYPSASVIANDLSPIQPVWVPPNCTFEVDDAESDWPYPLNHFDFIHVRSLGGAISNWPKLYKQAMRHLKPGGWIEVIEPRLRSCCDDGTLPEDGYMIKICDLFVEALGKIGKIGDVAESHEQWILDAGFAGVEHHIKKIPGNPWPKEKPMKDLGLYHLQNLLQGIEAYMIAPLTRILGMPAEEADKIVQGACREVADRKVHLYTRVHILIGKKPLD